VSDVKVVLQRVIPEFDMTMNYMPHSEFDFVFRSYVERYYGELYRQITDAIGLFEYSSALRMLQAAAQDRARELDVAEEYFAIVYDASVRYVFDRVCVELPDPLKTMTKALLGKFIEHCEQIRAMTPSDLSEELHGFMPSQRSQPIVDLFQQSPELARVVEFISEIQFYNSPRDICWFVSRAIAICREAIATCTYRNQKCGGDPDAPVPQHVITVQAAAVTFDDLFTYLFMATSVNPPANVLAIGDYLKSFPCFESSNQLEYAATSVQGAVNWIRKFDADARR
jgi:hypothetical protein